MLLYPIGLEIAESPMLLYPIGLAMLESPMLLYPIGLAIVESPMLLYPRSPASASGSASASLFQRDDLERIAGAAMLET